jgi:hypothetical protein
MAMKNEMSKAQQEQVVVCRCTRAVELIVSTSNYRFVPEI